MKLVEWTKHYIKYRDTMRRKIKSIIENDTDIIVEEKNGLKINYLIHEDLSEIKKLNNNKNVIITLNSKKNVDTMIKLWDEHINHPETAFMFVNITTNEKWLISPHHHHKIADPENFRSGLMALYSTIKSTDKKK